MLTKLERKILTKFFKEKELVDSIDIDQFIEEGYASSRIKKENDHYSLLHFSLVKINVKDEITILNNYEKRFCDHLFKVINVLTINEDNLNKEEKYVIKDDMKNLDSFICETESAMLYILDEYYNKSFQYFVDKVKSKLCKKL